MPPKRTAASTPQGDAEKGKDVEGSHKKTSGPYLMPAKRANPMKEERQGVQRPPSRVMTATPVALPVAAPLVRSKLLTQRDAVSRLAYGLTLDKTKPGDGTPIANLPPAPELDTQWIALRRMQGRYIAGPHGDLLKADGIASGVTEPFFFSAVRPGSSANKRASGWFGRVVQPMLATIPIDQDPQQPGAGGAPASSLKRNSMSNPAGGNSAAAAAGGGGPLSGRTEESSNPGASASNTNNSKKPKKNPNPKTLREWVAFSFGGPAQILAGTPPVTKELHAQIFPLVRADGNVEIALVASKVIAAIAPMMADGPEVAAAWMERIAERDRNAVEDAAVAQAAATVSFDDAGIGGIGGGGAESEIGGVSASASVMAARAAAGGAGASIRKPLGAEEAAAATPTPATKSTTWLEPPPAGAPYGCINYAVLLYSIRQLLLSHKSIDWCYDMCDVCCDGVVSKEAVKRQVGALMGKKEQQPQAPTPLSGAMLAPMFSASTGAAAREPLPVVKSSNNNNNNNNNNANYSESSQEKTSNSRSQSLAGGFASTTVPSSGATSLVGAPLSKQQQQQQAARPISPLSSGGTRSKSNVAAPSFPSLQQQQQRSLRKLHDDLVLETQQYEAMRQQHVMTQAEFVHGIIATTTLGPEPPKRERAPPPCRFWVTAQPRYPPALVASPHFHFPISTALMRAFNHIAGFEGFRSLFKGKSKKKGASLPSMRQEHITRQEFGDIFVSDPHVCAAFVPFLMRCAIRDLGESELGPAARIGGGSNSSGGSPATAGPASGGGGFDGRFDQLQQQHQGGDESMMMMTMTMVRSPARSTAAAATGGAVPRGASFASSQFK